ncbi:MAG TPA: IS66 family transposase [Mycobacterium sp.]|nr:IS66 family transposase [Mycobacterium sp.]
MRFDLQVPASEEMSRDELLVVVAAQACQLAQLREANEALRAKLARLEHLLSRNSGNSSSPPSHDDDPGKPLAPQKPRRGGSVRARGKQPGAPGSRLGFTDAPDRRRELYPRGRCGCGAGLAGSLDLGVVDRYQQHEIPPVVVRVTQYDLHQVRCRCGRLHTADRPDGARSGPAGYGPNLAAFATYLMVVHFVPAHRVVALLESLTGAAPSVGYVHGLLARTAGLLAGVHSRIRALLTRAHAVSCDETPLKVGPKTPKVGKKKAEQYLLVACTDRYTHYLLGDRSLDTFTASVLADLPAGAVIVHDRYQNYDCVPFDRLTHQLCTQHLLRDLDDAAQVYPDNLWPTQTAGALRELIHQANLARDHGATQVADQVRDPQTDRFRHGVRVGLSDTLHHGTRPGERKARLLLQVLRDREDDVLRFTTDLAVPPTSNQAERDLRPAKCQQNVSGRLTSAQRTQDRYTIRGYVSTAAKHGHNALTALRDAITGQPWIPPDPAPI